jgi:hypothetical protein
LSNTAERKILSPKDLNGLTIQNIKDRIESGETLDSAAQYCLEMSLLRVKLFAEAYGVVLAEEIFKIDEQYLTEQGRKDILASCKWVFYPMVKGLERTQFLQVPGEGLKHSLDFYTKELLDEIAVNRTVIFHSVSPLLKVIKKAVASKGLLILDHIPDLFANIPAPFSDETLAPQTGVVEFSD